MKNQIISRNTQELVQKLFFETLEKIWETNLKQKKGKR